MNFLLLIMLWTGVLLQAATTIVVSTPLTVIDENKLYIHILRVTDSDGKKLTWSIKDGTALPRWLSLNTEVKVTTFSGSGVVGSVDANGTVSSFHYPEGIVADSKDNIYVVDYYNNKIRKITPAGAVTTFAGSGRSGSIDGKATAASFAHPIGIAVDSSDNIYVADNLNNEIRKITQHGDVTTIAGTKASGSIDGNITVASFNRPCGITIDSSDNIYVADTNNHKIRKITPMGIVTTLAGSGEIGSINGNGTSALFHSPQGMAVDSKGNIYVADTNNHKIRKITPMGVVTTFAGSGKIGSIDGDNRVASFNYPQAVAVDGKDNIFVADLKNHKVRKITPIGIVTTFAGSGANGSIDGNDTSASFSYPKGIVVDSKDNIYVSNTYNHNIRKIDSMKKLFGIPTHNDIGENDVNLTVSNGVSTIEFNFKIIVKSFNSKELF